MGKNFKNQENVGKNKNSTKKFEKISKKLRNR